MVCSGMHGPYGWSGIVHYIKSAHHVSYTHMILYEVHVCTNRHGFCQKYSVLHATTVSVQVCVTGLDSLQKTLRVLRNG